MTRSVTFENLTHDQLLRLSAAYDEIKNGAPVQGFAIDQIPAQTHLSDAEPNVATPSPIADYQPKPAMDEAIEIDAVGVPYNKEFHSKTKLKTAAGEWRMCKGADKAGVKAWRDQHVRGGARTIHVPAEQSEPVQQFTPPSMPQPVVPVPTEPLDVPDYGTWYELFKTLWGDGRLNTETLAQMNQQARAVDASAYANDDQARGMSYQFMQKLAA